MKENNITTISLEAAQKAKGQTDFDRLAREGDYDGPVEDWENDLDWSKAELVMPEPKKMISLRVDADVLEFFKSQGKGYQTRMNAVLKAYKDAQANR
ncbi:MAG: BrnA antitoxin family protein [Pseudomonadota bacterium]